MKSKSLKVREAKEMEEVKDTGVLGERQAGEVKEME